MIKRIFIFLVFLFRSWCIPQRALGIWIRTALNNESQQMRFLEGDGGRVSYFKYYQHFLEFQLYDDKDENRSLIIRINIKGSYAALYTSFIGYYQWITILNAQVFFTSNKTNNNQEFNSIFSKKQQMITWEKKYNLLFIDQTTILMSSQSETFHAILYHKMCERISGNICQRLVFIFRYFIGVSIYLSILKLIILQQPQNFDIQVYDVYQIFFLIILIKAHVETYNLYFCWLCLKVIIKYKLVLNCGRQKRINIYIKSCSIGLLIILGYFQVIDNSICPYILVGLHIQQIFCLIKQKHQQSRFTAYKLFFTLANNLLIAGFLYIIVNANEDFYNLILITWEYFCLSLLFQFSVSYVQYRGGVHEILGQYRRQFYRYRRICLKKDSKYVAQACCICQKQIKPSQDIYDEESFTEIRIIEQSNHDAYCECVQLQSINNQQIK